MLLFVVRMDLVGGGAKFTRNFSPNFGALRSDLADLEGGVSVLKKFVLAVTWHFATCLWRLVRF